MLDPDQQKAIEAVVSWYESAGDPSSWRNYCNDGEDNKGGECPDYPHTHGFLRNHEVMSIGGLAGTGKTHLVRALSAALSSRYGNTQIAYVTPTHKAAAVLRRKLTGTDAEGRVRTFHSLLYQVVAVARCKYSGKIMKEAKGSCKCGAPDDCECPRHFSPCEAAKQKPHDCHPQEELSFSLRDTVGGYRDLLLCDESSMLTDEQVTHMKSLGLPVLLVGDYGQLPPVKAKMNHWTLNPNVRLTINHRQGEESGIISAALAAREGKQLLPGTTYGDGSTVIISRTHPDAEKMFRRFRPGSDKALIVWTNQMRAKMNQFYHGEGGPRVGDRVVLLARSMVTVIEPIAGGWKAGDRRWCFTNTTGEIVDVKEGSAKSAIMMIVRLDEEYCGEWGSYILCPALLRQFGAIGQLSLAERPRKIPHTLWDYAYAMTAHRAQGSEFHDVIIIDERPSEYPRWMYTAASRARERLVVVRW